jgi:predicted metal-dependent phosphoesterase TrpH
VKAGVIDLHLHSTASDGRLDPGPLVMHAGACGVRILALTDHDTTAGLDAAGAAAAAIGLAFVPGVEISADWRGRSIHVLGLAIDPSERALAAGLRGLAAERERRAGEIARRLDAAGAPGREALVRIRGLSELPTRTHFARALSELGAVRSLAEAFDLYLGRGRPAAVPSRWPAMAEAVAWIRAAGGVAVLAHPLRYPLSPGARRELCREFGQAGGRGLEVVCGGGSAAQVDQAVSLAQRTGLAGSVGSDFHDPAIPWNPPGRLAKLPGAVPAVWTEPSFSLALPEPA